MNTMKAVRIHTYGSPDVLVYEDAPCPSPRADEVIVRVVAAGINPVDWKTRAGTGMAGRYANPFPLILGWDVSGTVEAVGEDVTRFKPNDAVFGMVGFPDIGSAYAEYVSASEQHLVLKPDTVEHIDAAAVPLAALTAWQALFDVADLRAGQRVLIHAAAGGVGHLAVQIAKWKGAYVIGTASADNLDYVRSLGADDVIDYKATRYEDTVRDVDVVLEAVGGETMSRSFSVIKPGGTFVSITGKPDTEEAAKFPIKVTNILVHTDGVQMSQIADLMATGHLKPTVSHVYPLAEIRQAHEAGQSRTMRRGKIVLQP